MERRCVLCNEDMSDEDISEKNISQAFDDAYGLEFGWPAGPPEMLSPVSLTDRWGLVHGNCADAYGSGLTPDELNRQLWECLWGGENDDGSGHEKTDEDDEEDE